MATLTIERGVSLTQFNASDTMIERTRFPACMAGGACPRQTCVSTAVFVAASTRKRRVESTEVESRLACVVEPRERLFAMTLIAVLCD